MPGLFYNDPSVTTLQQRPHATAALRRALRAATLMPASKGPRLVKAPAFVKP